MSEFKVGDIVTNTKTCSEDNEGMKLRITKIRAGYIYSTINLENGHEDFHHLDHLKLVERTLDNLVLGDIIVNEDGEAEREVAAVGPKYVVLLDKWDKSDDDDSFSIDDLKKGGYKLKSQDELVELTLKEVAQKLNVDVDKLRIKE